MLRVKFERLRRGWNQTTLAFRARVSAAEISRIETGRAKPYPGQVKRLCRALGLTAGSLLENVVEDGPDGGSVSVARTDRRNAEALARDAERRNLGRQRQPRSSCARRPTSTSSADGPRETKTTEPPTRGERSHA